MEYTITTNGQERTVSAKAFANFLSCTTGFTASVRNGSVMVYDDTTGYISLETFIIFTIGRVFK